MNEIECHCIKLPSGRILKCDACDSTITFPEWVKGPTECATRTFSVVLPKDVRYPYTRHGSHRIVKAFRNRPMVKLPRRGLPGFYYGWADTK